MAPDTATGSGPTARRLVLGSQLRRLREAKQISREDAGYAIRGSGSKISRLELGRVGFKERDVADLLTLYGVEEDSERESFLDLVRRSNEPGWWNRYNDLIAPWFQDFVGLEESASRIQTFELQFIPGLLQTERYARAVASQGRPEAEDDEVDRRVRLRLQRQRMFARPKAPRVWAVIDESVLHRPIGGKSVMREQIESLLDATKLPTITLQVLPFSLGRSAAEGAYTILRFAEPEIPDIVYLEHLCGALYLDKPEDIEVYSKVSHRLAVDALTPEGTRKMLHERLREL
ncbi:XRE family transcriptional regulator [Saccharopolyspora rhizosphaerae]|uniref:XRE family transcriptional regulator n=1 Tax=Saccharopolyspora rhizosphaerae TaxID=2492662 RepID=A0A426JIG8_9PSEU|nr:helix-turn-helix transcriptional regulator [Saccharopolyspora rhizosphaerae]RRO12830.1 XRE family transcriptional regulator [Saccharopolyspora rhizosphaerae]